MQEWQEQRKEVEKCELKLVETNSNTPGVQMSDNKDKRSKLQESTIDNDLVQEKSHAWQKNIATLENNADRHEGREMGDGMIEKG